ncbi:MAG: tetratricopeptide repeat-containing sensor histidine kinase [Microscillaceae bacterium]|nr:tetratricopeptide repeat-containing sensor histidine kinase [Microscillaceae bacterium]MDW8461774.1 tetratricopeptide repeat-containing sensor histidine kinase [Cytophagales bacterium]
MGVLFLAKNKEKEALEYFEKATSYYNLKTDSILIANIYFDVSSYYYDNEKYVSCLEYLTKSLNYLPKDGKGKLLHRNIMNTQGLCYQKMKKYDKAEKSFIQALQFSKNLRDTFWIGLVGGNLAVIYRVRKQNEKAEQLLKIDVMYSKKYKIFTSAANALAELGEIYAERGEFEKSKAYLDSAMHFIKVYGNNNLKLRRRAYEKYLTLYEKSKDYLNLAATYKILYHIQDSLNLISRKKDAEILQNKYEYADMKRQNQILAKENLLQQTYLYFSFATSAIVLTVLLITLYYFRIAQKQKKEIAQQKAKLEELNATKNLLISLIGHDFRSPLTNIQGILNLLNTDTITHEEAKPYYPQMLQKATNTLDFLDNLLKWSKTQMEGLQISPTKIHLKTTACEIIELYQSSLENKKIEVICQIDEQHSVKADKEMLKAIVRNLISNAIKFTPEEGKIILKTTLKNEYIQVSIQDTGVGMPSEVRENLFKRTIKSQQGTNQEKGTGFGLLFVKDFVEKNGGTIWVESEEGKGTTFHFTLPQA